MKFSKSSIRQIGRICQDKNLSGNFFRILPIIVLIAWVFIIGTFFWQGSYVFEGNLITREMSFTYTGKQKKLLLSYISGIRKLDIEGNYDQPLTLMGRFSSNSDPELNKKLSKLKQLTIKLTDARSHLIFTPSRPNQPSELNIVNLQVNPDIQVRQLTYDPTSEELSFCLQSSNTSPESCLFPNQSNSISQVVGDLNLNLGGQPLTVNLERFSSKELEMQAKDDDFNEITFSFTPENDQPILMLRSPTTLFIGLPELTEEISSEHWLWGDIDVKDVKFSRYVMTGNQRDDLEMSTILKGKVRMGKEVINIQKNQFLITLPDESAIKKLSYIQIHSQLPQGLQVLISGKSQGVAVGLSPEFPLQRITPNWLANHFSPEAVNALLAFFAALTAVLLPHWLEH